LLAAGPRAPAFCGLLGTSLVHSPLAPRLRLGDQRSSSLGTGELGKQQNHQKFQRAALAKRLPYALHESGENIGCLPAAIGFQVGKHPAAKGEGNLELHAPAIAA
jgi:hypothetical protein